MTKQIKTNELESVCQSIATECIGFATAKSLAKSLNISQDAADKLFADVLMVAARGVYRGFEYCGALDEMKLQEKQNRDRIVAKSKAEHNAWKRATGNRF